MKLKIRKRKKAPVEKPDMYEKQIYLGIRFFMIVYLLPAIIAFLLICFFSAPYLPLKAVLWGSALGLGSYFIMVSMIKEGTKTFWVIFSTIILLQPILFFFGLPEHVFFSDLSGLFYALSFIIFGLLFFAYLCYGQYKELKRNPNMKFSGEVEVDRIELKPKKKKRITEGFKRKLKVNRQKLSKAKPLNFIEPAEFSNLRAKLTLWGLPILTTGLLIMGFFGDVSNYPQYVTASAMGLGGFLFLVSMVRPSTLTFWIIFFLALIIGTPMAISPPDFLPKTKEAQIALISILFLGAALYYIYLVRGKVPKAQ